MKGMLVCSATVHNIQMQSCFLSSFLEKLRTAAFHSQSLHIFHLLQAHKLLDLGRNVIPVSRKVSRSYKPTLWDFIQVLCAPSFYYFIPNCDCSLGVVSRAPKNFEYVTYVHLLASTSAADTTIRSLSFSGTRPLHLGFKVVIEGYRKGMVQVTRNANRLIHRCQTVKIHQQQRITRQLDLDQQI